MSAEAALPGFRRPGNFSAARTSVYQNFVLVRSHDSFGRPLQEDLHAISSECKNLRITRQKAFRKMTGTANLLLRNGIGTAMRKLGSCREMPERQLLTFSHEVRVVADYVVSEV